MSNFPASRSISAASTETTQLRMTKRINVVSLLLFLPLLQVLEPSMCVEGNRDSVRAQSGGEVD
jgi:hypothetical protein